MARLQIKNLTKTFGKDVRAVDNVSLSVEEGEYLTLLGPSGCGKSTLLRLVAGLEKPDSGQVFIDGKEVTIASPAQRDVAMVFQNYALYPHMRVFENIAVSLKLRHLPREQIRAKVKEAAVTLGIENLLERLPRELSGGQRQRVALARALVRKPRLFLLDEPLSNLDAILREKTRAELKILFSRLRGTVIYVTHDQAEAISMSSRVAVMEAGRIQQVGPPRQVYAEPANTFVAGFVGSPSISFVEGRIDSGHLTFGRYSVKLNRDLRGLWGPVIAGVRPEDVEVVAEGRPLQDSSPGQAKVLLVEPFGSYEVATIDHEGSVLRARLRPGSARQGTEVAFSLRAERIHLFDKQTGLSLEDRQEAGRVCKK